MSAQWQKKWRRKSEKEKNQIVMVVVMAVVAAYALLVFQFTYEDNKKTINGYNRQKDRLEKKKAKAPPKPPNTGSLAKQLKSLEGQIKTAQATKEKLGGSFVSLSEPQEMQKLRFALSNIANESGVNIMRMVDAGLVRTSDDDAPSASEIENVTNNPYGRPLIQVRAQASYGSLLQFFQSLTSLRYKVVVVRYGVFVRESKNSISSDEMLQVSKAQAQPLEVSILLAL